MSNHGENKQRLIERRNMAVCDIDNNIIVL